MLKILYKIESLQKCISNHRRKKLHMKSKSVGNKLRPTNVRECKLNTK